MGQILTFSGGELTGRAVLGRGKTYENGCCGAISRAQIRKSKKREKGKEKVGIDEFSPFVLRPRLSSSIDRMWEGGRATEKDRLTPTCRLAYLKPSPKEYSSRSAGSQEAAFLLLPTSHCI